MLIYLLIGLGIAAPAITAENEITLLTIEGDLIGKIDNLDQSGGPSTIIAAYYELLPADIRNQALRLRTDLTQLVPDYEVAYNAADSAEITEIRSDVFVLWAQIQTLHAQFYSSEAAEILRGAYRLVYPVILGEQ